MAKELAWSGEDAAWLRELLGKPSGQRLLANLKDGTPKVKGTKFETVALESKYRQGWEDCLESLMANAQSGTKEVAFNEFVNTDN